MRFTLLGLLVALPLISAAIPQWDSDDWVGNDAPTCIKQCAVQVGTELVKSWMDGSEGDRICGDSMNIGIGDNDFECVCRDEGFSKKWGQCVYAKCSEEEVEVALENMKKSCGQNNLDYNEDAFKDGKGSGVGRSCASLGLVGVAAVGAVMVVL